MEPEIRLDEAARERLDRIGQEFLVEILGVAGRRDARNLDALAELGHALTRLGRHEEGLEIDRRLARLVPENPIVHYNLACSLALLGRADEAFEALEQSIARGYRDVEHLLEDDDLRPLQRDRRFAALVRRLRAEAAADG